MHEDSQRGEQHQRRAARCIEPEARAAASSFPRVRLHGLPLHAAARRATLAAPFGVFRHRHPQAECGIPDKTVNAVHAGVAFHGSGFLEKRGSGRSCTGVCAAHTPVTERANRRSPPLTCMSPFLVTRGQRKAWGRPCMRVILCSKRLHSNTANAVGNPPLQRWRRGAGSMACPQNWGQAGASDDAPFRTACSSRAARRRR
ncbi:hypothetical protein D9M73_110820 [compost metagenome]